VVGATLTLATRGFSLSAYATLIASNIIVSLTDDGTPSEV